MAISRTTALLLLLLCSVVLVASQNPGAGPPNELNLEQQTVGNAANAGTALPPEGPVNNETPPPPTVTTCPSDFTLGCEPFDEDVCGAPGVREPLGYSDANGTPCFGCQFCDFPCPVLPCTVLPNPCDLVLNTTYRLNGKTCPGCPVCKMCPPPVGCVPIAPDCKKMVQDTFTSPDNILCNGCKRCEDACPTLPNPCPALPVGCLNVTTPVLKINSLLNCTGCPVCEDSCPPFNPQSCPSLPSNCKNIKQNTQVIGSVTCQACPTCDDIPCPTPQCTPVPPTCKLVLSTTFIGPSGQDCPGCPKCGDTCPPVTCQPLPENCFSYRETYTIINGHLNCTGCPECEKTCPQKTCAIPPETCKNVTRTILFVVGNRTCYDCPECSDCPTQTCNPVPTTCTPRNTTFLFKGQVCAGCQECNPDCPNLLTCPAVPAGCKNITTPNVVINGSVCIGCPVCNDVCPPPPTNCSVIPPDCKKVETQYSQHGGILCAGCKICTERACPPVSTCPPLVGNCTAIQTTVITLPDGTKCEGCKKCVDCPKFECPELTNCKKISPTSISWDGRLCPGCPLCKECPKPTNCAPLPRCCLKIETPTYTIGNLTCNTCPRCTQLPECPVPKCVPLPPNCRNVKQLNFTFQGLICKGCEICTDTTCKDCPALACPVQPNCQNWNQTSFQFEGKTCAGCPVCSDKPKKSRCPTPCCAPLPHGCKQTQRTFFEYQGQKCLGCPKCTKIEECIKNCKCPGPIIKYFDIPKCIIKKNFIPYPVIIHVPADVRNLTISEVHQYQTMRFKYFYVLKYRIEQFRALLIHFRHVVKKLYVTNRVTGEQYQSATTIIRRKRIVLEKEIKTGTITLGSLEKDLKSLRYWLSKVGFNSFSPARVCKVIGAKRVCGLHPNAFYFNWNPAKDAKTPAPVLNKTFIKNGWFKRVVYTREPSRVIRIVKVNKKSKTIRFIRSSRRWTARVIKMNRKLRQSVFAKAATYLFKSRPNVRAVIAKRFGFTKSVKELRSLFKTAKGQFGKIRKFLLKKHKKSYRRAVHKALRTKAIKRLQNKFKPVVSIKEFPTRITEEIVRVPAGVFFLEEAEIINLLSARFQAAATSE